MKEKIIEYLIKNYNPHTIIIYGSYADGSNNLNSDFDALIITDKECTSHDGNYIDNILLDVFIYNTSYFKNELNCEKFIQIYDGDIVLDTKSIGKELQHNINEYIKENSKKSKEEKMQLINWCEKMLLRIDRNDTEGYFRWHWLLVDSLEIYFIICDEYYHGPKKSLLKMKDNDKEGFNYYNKALCSFDRDSLKDWLAYIKKINTINID